MAWRGGETWQDVAGCRETRNNEPAASVQVSMYTGHSGAPRRTSGKSAVTPQTRYNRLATCMSVVASGERTHPSNTCTTSSAAALCTTAVRAPTPAAYAPAARCSAFASAGGRGVPPRDVTVGAAAAELGASPRTTAPAWRRTEAQPRVERTL